MKYETILLEREGPLARLTFNRPEHRNGIINSMVREVCEAVTEISQDDDARVLVLTGAGNSFCPGADLNNIGADSAIPQETLQAQHFQIAAILHSMPQLTIAAVNGACAGAGFGWACGCDIRVATTSARFNTAFLNVAVAGDMGLPWSLPRLIGAAKARELSFFSEKLGAEEAQRIGLVARVWPDEEFQDQVEGMLQTFTERSPTALKYMKAHYLAAESMPFDSYLQLETERHLWIAGGSHAREAFKAFIEKRKPQFD